MTKELRLKPSFGQLGLAVCCVTHIRVITHWGTGEELLAPLRSPIAGGEMTFTQTGLRLVPVSVGYMEVISTCSVRGVLWERCAFLPPCWVLGVPEAPTWHMGCAELRIPPAEPALDGAWAVTSAAFSGECFDAPVGC